MELIIKPKHGSHEWLNLRHRDNLGRCTFGASEAPALMNVSPFMSRADLWHSKHTTPSISETSAAMHVGNVLEGALVDELGRRLGVKMHTPDVMYRDGRFIVTLDAVSVDAKHFYAEADVTIVGEVKTTRRHRISTIDDVPQDYLWQCWAQMLVIDRPVFLIVLDRDLSITHLEIPRNEQALDTLRVEAEKFGKAIDTHDETIANALIDNFTSEQIADLWKSTPKVKELNSDEFSWVKDLIDARDMKRQSEQIEKCARDHIARIMLDAEIATVNGMNVLSWKEQAGRESVDLASLRRDHPDLVKTYTKQSSPIRVMRSTSKGDNQ
jgi:predicted phage-related endonuclease